MEHKINIIVLPSWLHYMHTNGWTATFSSVPVFLLLVSMGWFCGSLPVVGLGFFGGALLATLGAVFTRVAQRITTRRYGVGIEAFVYRGYRFVLIPASIPTA